MKKLLYKGEEIATLTEEEASQIINYKGISLAFRNQRLVARLVEIREDKTETQEKRITEYTLEELHSTLGNFEKEYHEATTGKTIHNEILGYVCEGNVEHALRIGAITEQKGNYFVKLPEYVNYQLKVEGLKELNRRRDYAKKQNEPNLAEMDMSF